MSDIDNDSAPSHASILDAIIARRLGQLRVHLPGRVERYDADLQAADVQALVMEGRSQDGERVVEPLPIFPRVPIVFLGAGANRQTFPVAAGDLVTLAFCSSSIDRLLVGAGDLTDPEDDRKHNLADVIAFPGFHTFGSVPTRAPLDAVVTHAASGVRVKLGSPDANQALMRGTAFRAAQDTWNQKLTLFLAPVGPLQAFVTALAAMPGMAGAAGTFATAVADLFTSLQTYKTAIAGAASLSTRVFIE